MYYFDTKCKCFFVKPKPFFSTTETDRNNVVAMKGTSVNYPLEDIRGTLFDTAKVIDAPNAEDRVTRTGLDIAISMATAGHFKNARQLPNPFQVKGCNAQQAKQLDCYRPSYNGLLLKLRRGVYRYMCTRNNNFSNRNQKSQHHSEGRRKEVSRKKRRMIYSPCLTNGNITLTKHFVFYILSK